MSTANPPIDPERLLSHAGFLRGLAYGLVVGADRADDVVQETWLAAVAHPPEPRATLRPWLARVARNAASMARRTERRRDRREQAVARADRAPSPAEILEREAVRRRVVEAVLALDDPYRAVVLLRYFDDLPPREVARRLAVPVETVRTRLRRGLERLRAALDASHGGERRRWALGIAPLLPRPTASSVPWSAILVGSLAASAIGAALLAWHPWTSPSADPASTAAATADAALGAGPLLAARPGPPAAPAAPALQSAAELVSRTGRAVGVLRGFALDGERLPVAGASIVARPTLGVLPDGMSLPPAPGDERRTTTDAKGQFTIEGLPTGGYSIVATKEGLGRAAAQAFATPDAPWTDLQFRSPRYGAGSLHVRVLGADRDPVPGAHIYAWLFGEPAGRDLSTDALGEASLPLGEQDAWEGGAFGVLDVVTPRGLARTPILSDGIPDPNLEVVVGPPGALTGRVGAPAGTDLASQTVVAEPLPWAAPPGFGRLSTHPDGEGRYRFDGLAPATYRVFVVSRGGLRMDAPRKPLWETSPEPADYAIPTCDVPAGGRGVCDLALVVGGALRGRVVREGTGAPVAGARIDVLLPAGAGDHPERLRYHGLPVWRFDGPMPDQAQDPVRFRVLATDADGRYEAAGLLPSVEYVVRAIPEPTLSFDVRLAVVVEDGRTTELTHRVSPAGVLELAAPARSCLGIRRGDDGPLVAVLYMPQGPGHGAIPSAVPGLPAGRYDLVEGHGSLDLRRYARFEIRAGAPTLVDLADEGARTLHGRVLRGGRPVAGALVQPFITLPWRKTDEGGRFEVALQGTGPLVAGTCEVRPPEPDAVQVRLAVAGSAPTGPPSKGAPPTPGAGGGVPSRDGSVDLELPTARLDLLATRADGAPAAGVELALTGPYVYERRTTAADGRARWVGLPAGTFTVKGRFPERDARTRTDFEIGDSDVEVTLAEPPSSPLVVSVLDREGRPVPGAVVSLQVLPGSSAAAAPPTDAWTRDVRFDDPPARTDAQGLARFAGVPHGWLRAFAHLGSGLGIHGDHGRLEASFPAPAPGPLEVRLDHRDLPDRSER